MEKLLRFKFFNQYNHFNLGSLIEDIGVLCMEKIGV